MFLYLEPQELVNSGQGLSTARRNPYATAALGFFILIADCRFLLLHRLDAGWNLVMDKHRYREIPLRKHHGNVFEVGSNLIPTGRVLHVVGANLDCPAIGQQAEMVDGL